MSESGATPSGWYHASGDPEGTERYWDGAQWVGEPRVSQQIPVAPPPQQFAAPSPATPQTYGAPGAGLSAAPAGYQPYPADGQRSMTPAGYGARVVAYLIDFGLYFVGIVAVVIAGFATAAVVEPVGIVVFLVGFLAVIGFMIWNIFVRQGRTGQSIGKKQQGIKLVKDDTGGPVGGGMAFVRYFVAGLLSNFTCGVYGILDLLWPLWDADNKRLTDKIMSMSVVEA